MQTMTTPSLQAERHFAQRDAETQRLGEIAKSFAAIFAAAVKAGDADQVLDAPAIGNDRAQASLAALVAGYADSEDLARIALLVLGGKIDDAQRMAALVMSTVQQDYAEVSAEQWA